VSSQLESRKEAIMAKAAKKTATSPKATKSPAPKTALKVVDPVGNSGIPAPAPKGFNGRKVTLLTKDIPNRKIAGQAMIILNTLEALGGTATQGEIVGALLDNGLKTVQTPKRIYDFYRKQLTEMEYIKLD
tara:strand:+ start:555 stop:947 length:393 start_codon:yes stop_codon:yes gene_type:complete